MISKTFLRSKALFDGDPRLQDRWEDVTLSDLQKIPEGAPILVCYPDDEGVRLNGGRPGAARGPERSLYFLGRMIFRGVKVYRLAENFVGGSLDERHDRAFQAMLRLFRKKLRVITVGGGHDYGFPDGAAFLESFKGQILNVDAHLDVRPVVNGEFNSGTAFYRLVQKYGGKQLIEWGIQPQNNATAHVAWAKQHNVKLLSFRDRLPSFKRPVGLSVCLDAFEGIRGVSAPSFSGLAVRQGLDAIEKLSPSSPWLGLYEVAPDLDPLSEDSARLAALFAYYFIHAGQKETRK